MRTFETPLGKIKFKHLGHASLLIEWSGQNIFVDPYSEVCNFSQQPKADLILVTHHHFDHLDPKALKEIVQESTLYIASVIAAKELPGATPLAQGESTTYKGIEIEAKFAYNIVQKNEEGNPFHPKGEGNGYLLNFGGFKLYIAGDTELIPEMEQLGEIDLAFIPKNLPYTMSDDMFVEAVELIRPKQLFAYHYFEIDPQKLREKMPKGVELLNR
ncbi:MAG: MBL fold metallo-hydrolase [Bacteroidales bacterium]